MYTTDEDFDLLQQNGDNIWSLSYTVLALCTRLYGGQLSVHRSFTAKTSFHHITIHIPINPNTNSHSLLSLSHIHTQSHHNGTSAPSSNPNGNPLLTTHPRSKATTASASQPQSRTTAPTNPLMGPSTPSPSLPPDPHRPSKSSLRPQNRQRTVKECIDRLTPTRATATKSSPTSGASGPGEH